MNNIISWWLAYSQGWIDAYKARLGAASLRSPALRESVTRRFPERPFSVGMDVGKGESRTVVVQLRGGCAPRVREL